MSSDNLMLGLALIMVVVATVGVGFTYSSVSNLENALTGFATDTATTNLTVSTNAAINFTTDNINFGTGKINDGTVGGVLYTAGGVTTNTTGFTSVTQGFVLENIGNVNVTLDIKTAKVASAFLGGTSPSYQYNVTNKDAGACVPDSGYTLGTLVNATTSDNPICDVFGFLSGADELRIDISLFVPSDSYTGELVDIMTATATAVV